MKYTQEMADLIKRDYDEACQEAEPYEGYRFGKFLRWVKYMTAMTRERLDASCEHENTVEVGDEDHSVTYCVNEGKII